MNNKYLVTKANRLITSHYDLSLSEIKIILTLISLVQPEDKEFKPYQFKISEFMKLLGVQDRSKYIEVPKITKELMKKVFEIKEGNKLLQLAWICGAEYDKGTGTVELLISPYLKPYLLDLKELFISYPLENILKLTSKYSIRLYEILKANEFKQTVTIELDEIRNMFKLSETYKIYFNLRNKVIEQAKKEIVEKTDISFDYEPIKAKTGKKVVALKFTIKPNPKNKKKLEPQKQLSPISTEAIPTTQTDIEAIKDEFRRLYKGKLLDRFIKQMLEEKGLAHVQECLRTYKDYIKGQEIKNIGGHFKTFVMDGYAKPVAYNGNVPKTPQHPVFTSTPKEREEIEVFYSNLGKQKEKRSSPEVVQGSLKSMKDILSGKFKIDSLESK